MENNEIKNSKLIPRLRFPGFEGGWEEKKLGEVATFKRGMTITAKDTKNGDVPVIAGGQTPSYYHNVSNREGETIAISGSGAYAGFVSFWNTPVFLSDSFSVETEIDINKKYAFYFLKHKQQDLFFMQKGAGVPHVHGTDVGNLIIPLPSLPEQQKITSCLSELDNLIAAQNQKVDALKEKKKGLMQQLFPQPGETTPRLRFPGFEGEWEERKLGVVFETLSNSTLSRADLNDKQGKAMYVHYGDVLIKIGQVLDLSKEKLPYITDDSLAIKACKSILRNGDVIMADTAEDETVGKCTEIKNASETPVVSGLHTIPLRPLIRFADGFMGYYLNSDAYRKGLLPLMQGVKVTSLSRTAITGTSIKYPLSLSEQQKIASCLSSLDDLIAAESAKVEALKDHKKGLMQQLFPRPTK